MARPCCDLATGRSMPPANYAGGTPHPARSNTSSNKERTMPTGTQQSIEGLLCVLCTEVISEPWYESNVVCDACADQYANSCDVCSFSGINANELNLSGHRAIWSSDVPMISFNYTIDGWTTCEDCTYYCDNCSEAYASEDNMLDCCDTGPESVYNYSYKPLAVFYDKTSNGITTNHRAESDVLYMGIELEVAKMRDQADEFNDSLAALQGDFVYMKEDGSIGPDGVEIVTHPATLQAFEALFPFEQLDQARANGARSFAYGNCGFHIHVSRSAFSATHMWKFIKFQMNQPGLCQRVAQRVESSYASWYFEESEKRELPDYIKGKKYNGRRYLAINFQNRVTVELRYFKGNILRSAIMKNLEFVQSVYDYTKRLTVRDVTSGGLTDVNYYYEWLDSSEGYENLKYFLSNDRNKESE